MKPKRLVAYDLSDSSLSDDEKSGFSDGDVEFIKYDFGNNGINGATTDTDIESIDESEINDNENDSKIVFNVLNRLVDRVSKAINEENGPARLNSNKNYAGVFSTKPKRWTYSFDRKGYRESAAREPETESDSDNEYSASSDNASAINSDLASSAYDTDDSDYVFTKIVNASHRIKNKIVKPKIPPKTKGELSYKDLPPIENLNISLNEAIPLQKLGHVTSIVDTLVVVLSEKDLPPVDQDTVLFTEDRSYFGQVFETFGPVVRPYYSVRFNDIESLRATNITVSKHIYFVPNNAELTHNIFADNLRQMKGSDASWKDNNEPPVEALDFSDDEEERRFKARRRAKTGLNAEDGAQNGDSVDQFISENAPAPKRRMQQNKRRSNWPKTPNNNNVQNNATMASHNSPVALPNAPWFNRLRNPWNCSPNSFRFRSPPVFRSQELPSPSSSSSHDWIWMSEQAFRFPPPRIPPNFGRARVNVPPQHPLPPNFHPGLPPQAPPFGSSPQRQYPAPFSFTSRPPPPPQTAPFLQPHMNNNNMPFPQL